MRACLLFPVLVVFASAVYADDEKPLKPISELDFYKKVIEAKRKAKFTGTELQRQEQFKEFAAEFQKEFSQVAIELDGVITSVKWYRDWATIGYSTKTVGSFRKLAGLSSSRDLVFKCPQESVMHLKSGDKIHVTATIHWIPGIFSPSTGMRFYSHFAGSLDGHFMASEVNMTHGKEAFTFVQKVSK